MRQLTPQQKQWFEALRSGKYQQGGGRLNCDGKLCCLGVACEIAIENGIAITRGEQRHYGWDYGDDANVIPGEVAHWLGLKDSAIDIFVDLNDGQKRSFPEIADYAEQHADELFEPELA